MPLTMRPRLLAGLLAAMLLSGVTTVLVDSGAPNAHAAGTIGVNDYPDANATDCSATFGLYAWCKGGTYLSPRRFAYRNCTDFAAYRVGISWGELKFPLDSNGNPDGNARGWRQGAINSGYTVSSVPVVGAVAWWGKSIGEFGHVAVVRGVNADGSANVEEYNYAGTGLYGTRNNVRAESYLYIKTSATSGPVVIRQGNTLWAKAGLTDAWVKLSDFGGQFQVSGNRIASLVNGTLYAKDGIGGTWYTLQGAVDDYAISSSAVVIRQGNTLWAKAGLTDAWVKLSDFGGQFQVSGNRIASLVNGTLYAKDGIGGTWYTLQGAVDDFDLEGLRPVTKAVPSAPGGVTVGAGDGFVNVAWSAAAANGSPVTAYTVTSSPGGKTCTWTSGPLSCTVSGLTNGTSYTFTVTATNSVGTSAASAPSAAVTPSASPIEPGAALTVSVTGGIGTATVTWGNPISDGGSPVTGFAITVNPGGATYTATAGARSKTITGLAAGTTYTFTVAAVNGVGEGPGTSKTAIGSTAAMTAPTAITYGTTTTITGTLKNIAGTALPGRTVTILAKASGATSYTAIATLTTSATGAFSKAIKPLKNTTYYARYDGGPARMGDASPVRTTTVKQKVTITVSDTTPTVGQTITFTGLVSPNATGRTLYLQRYTAGAWKTIKTTTITATSRYSITITITTPTNYKYRTYTGPRTGLAAGTSTTLTPNAT